MLKSELLEKLKDIAEDADVNETILSIDDFAKSSEIDVKKLTIDDYKNMLANNEVIKAYYQSSFDSAVGSAVTKHDQKFMKEKFPTLLEEEIKKRDTSDLTPDQLKIKELEEKMAKYEAEKAESLRLETNRSKLKDNGLNTDLARFIKEDSDIDFFKNLINDSVRAEVKNKLGKSNYKPPTVDNNLNTITKEQFNKMGYKERLKLYNEDKELYEKLQNEQ